MYTVYTTDGTDDQRTKTGTSETRVNNRREIMGYYSERLYSTMRINRQYEQEIIGKMLDYKERKPIKTWKYNPETKRLNHVDFPQAKRYPGLYLSLPENFGDTPETSNLDYYFNHINDDLDMFWELKDEFYYLRPGYDSCNRSSDDQIFEFLAPYIEDGGKAEYSGEDGVQWRIVIRDGKAYCIDPVITWEEPKALNIIGGYV